MNPHGTDDSGLRHRQPQYYFSAALTTETPRPVGAVRGAEYPACLAGRVQPTQGLSKPGRMPGSAPISSRLTRDSLAASSSRCQTSATRRAWPKPSSSPAFRFHLGPGIPRRPGTLRSGVAGRDAFCGKISVCNNLRQSRVPFSLTDRRTLRPLTPEFRGELQRFLGSQVVNGLRSARAGRSGQHSPMPSTPCATARSYCRARVFP